MLAGRGAARGVSGAGTPAARLIAESGEPFRVAMTHYGRAPNAFAREVLGLPPDPWQLEAGRALANGHRRVSIRSGHGVGKGHWLSTMICWFCCTRAPFKVGVTAPSAPQLHDALMADVRRVFNLLPASWRDKFDINLDRISLKSSPDNCFLTARTSRPDNPESLQGLHSENLLLVVDEASGVPDTVYAAAQGSMSTPGAITLLAGNPTRATGHFWRTHNLERDRWWTKRVSCLESPRVDREFVEEIEQRHGIDSNEYRIRVLGEFPLADDDTLIPSELVDAAMARDIGSDWVSHPEIWGLDVARFGSADSVLIKRRGPKVLEPPRRWSGISTMALAGAVKAEFDLAPPYQRPQLIVVDVIGIGSGVVDRLTEQSVPIYGCNVGETPSVAGRYHRLRDELWVRCREWLEARSVQLPYDDKLRADLCAPRVSYLSDGKMVVESKQQLRARGVASPDAADALIQTFVQTGMALQFGLGAILNSRSPVRAPMASME